MNDYTKGILTGASLILCFIMFISAKNPIDNLGDIVVNSIIVEDQNGHTVGALGATEYGGFLKLNNTEGKLVVFLSPGLVGGNVVTLDTAGNQTAFLGTTDDGSKGQVSTFSNGKTATFLGSNDVGGIFMSVNNKDQVSSEIGTGENGGGSGVIRTYQFDGKETVYIGTGPVGGGGFIHTSNSDGKETTYLGTAENGAGLLRVENNGLIEVRNVAGKQLTYLGTNKEGSGFIATSNKHGVKTGFLGANLEDNGVIILMDGYGELGWEVNAKDGISTRK